MISLPTAEAKVSHNYCSATHWWNANYGSFRPCSRSSLSLSVEREKMNQCRLPLFVFLFLWCASLSETVVRVESLRKLSTHHFRNVSNNLHLIRILSVIEVTASVPRWLSSLPKQFRSIKKRQKTRVSFSEEFVSSIDSKLRWNELVVTRAHS